MCSTCSMVVVPYITIFHIFNQPYFFFIPILPNTYRISRAETSLKAPSCIISTWLFPSSRVWSLLRFVKESAAMVPMSLWLRSL